MVIDLPTYVTLLHLWSREQESFEEPEGWGSRQQVFSERSLSVNRIAQSRGFLKALASKSRIVYAKPNVSAGTRQIGRNGGSWAGRS